MIEYSKYNDMLGFYGNISQILGFALSVILVLVGTGGFKKISIQCFPCLRTPNT